MLEFYEVNELEKKWEEYNKNKKQFSFLKSKPNFVFKFDKTILGLLALISIAIGAIFWLLKDDDKVSMASINENIQNEPTISDVVPNPAPQVQPTINTAPQTEIAAQNSEISRADYNISAPANDSNRVQNVERPSLNINDVGVLSSEDSGGFKITNTYENSANNQNFSNQNFANGGFNQGFNQANNVPNFNPNAQNFNQPMKNEIIDFGKAPLPPKQNVASNAPAPVNRAPISSRLEIRTSNLSSERQSLESKFYATNKIEYSLSLAEEAYNKKDYDNAIKWALTSNEIDKNNINSWIIFAKANYKKGRKDDAIYALETFNSKAKNGEIANLINQIKSGAL